ncbi:hypothetical protein BESB_000760 [Besnoitia besnoiti]|uniref:Transmembrane protein n=1 Tax=Besnoitia besnoiti TaxID=94643 RepID=A0A2A9MKJ1_BESBE|nr:hypothetical protein BESB_000760 [Besnoitia besnoiti]PFH37734.1 hypothetical protein BESB_000760 [Besnoitia besnoiti]
MAMAHFDTFSSPVRDSSSAEDEEAPSPADADLDGHELEDLDLRDETHEAEPSAPADAIIDVDPVPPTIQPPVAARTSTDTGEEKNSKFGCRGKVSLTHVLLFLTTCCLVFIAATIACRLAVGSSPTEPAVLFVITCIVVAVGFWGVARQSRPLTLAYACLLILLTATTMICGSIETSRFRDNFEALHALNRKPGLTPDEEKQLQELSEELKVLAAFVALYFLCSALVLVTAVLTIRLHFNISEKEREQAAETGQNYAEASASEEVTGPCASQANDGHQDVPSPPETSVPLALQSTSELAPEANDNDEPAGA